jgi:WD40 repeat protein
VLVKPVEEDPHSKSTYGQGYYTVGKTKVFVDAPEPYKSWTEGQANKPPQSALTLSYVHGYNGKTMQHNLFYDDTGDSLLYCIAGVGVKHHESKKQQQFVGHTEDVVCMGLHPSKKIVATGQRDPKGSGTPFFCVWDKEMKQLQKIEHHQREVQAVEFSHCGKYVMSIGGDDSHTFAIFDWQKDGTKPLLEGMTAKSKVHGLTHNPYCKDYVMEFAAFGQSFLKFLRVTKGPGDTLVMDQTIPSAPELKDVKSYHCATYRADGTCLVGTNTGLLLVFSGNNLIKSFQAHRDHVGAIVARPDNSFLTGGYDGKVLSWSADGEAGDDEITIPDMYGSVKKDPDVTSMDLSADGGKLVIGLKRSMIYEYKFADKSMTLVQKGNFGTPNTAVSSPILTLY